MQNQAETSSPAAASAGEPVDGPAVEPTGGPIVGQVFEALKSASGARIRAIPYKGGIETIQSMIAGETNMGVSGSVVVPHIRAGRLKALAACAAKRMPVLPEVPTCKEAGFPNIDPGGWVGIFAPRGTPTAIISKVNADAIALLNEEDFYQRIMGQYGFTKTGSTPAEFAKAVREDYELKRQMIQSAGIVAE